MFIFVLHLPKTPPPPNKILLKHTSKYTKENNLGGFDEVVCNGYKHPLLKVQKFHISGVKYGH
jgi:hypothetical protein